MGRGARRRRMAEKRGGLRYSARLQVRVHPVGMGSVAGTGGVAVGCAAGHRRGVCILALPLTVRNQEISGGFMDLIKRTKGQIHEKETA